MAAMERKCKSQQGSPCYVEVEVGVGVGGNSMGRWSLLSFSYIISGLGRTGCFFKLMNQKANLLQACIGSFPLTNPFPRSYRVLCVVSSSILFLGWIGRALWLPSLFLLHMPYSRSTSPCTVLTSTGLVPNRLIFSYCLSPPSHMSGWVDWLHPEEIEKQPLLSTW